MRHIAAFIIALTLFHPEASSAHDVESGSFNAAPLIGDMEVIASALKEERLTNYNVMVVAGATCAAMRTAQRDLVASNAADFLNENYPSADEVQAVDPREFAAFERQAFKKLNASDAVVTYVSYRIDENPLIPESSPALETSLEDEISETADVACEARQLPLGDPSAQAGDNEEAFARQLGLAAAGVTAIVVDAVYTVQTGGAGAAVLGIVSGGWGWNRVEEAVPAIKELWRSLTDWISEPISTTTQPSAG